MLTTIQLIGKIKLLSNLTGWLDSTVKRQELRSARWKHRRKLPRAGKAKNRKWGSAFMAQYKQEFPPLLPAGLHVHTMAQLEALTVAEFPLSQRRPPLWGNFAGIITELNRLQIRSDVWVDGSFLTQKIEPDDVDFAVQVPIAVLNGVTAVQGDFLRQMADCAFKASHSLHSFVFPSAPIGHIEFPLAEMFRKQWENDFGFSFVTREPKGIAKVEVRP